MLQQFETISQQSCNAMLHEKSSFQILPCNITFYGAVIRNEIQDNFKTQELSFFCLS